MFYMEIRDKLFGTYRIAHRIGGLFAVCVRYGFADIWEFRIFWDFVSCVEALLGIFLGAWSCVPQRQSLMIRRYDPDFDGEILSVHM